MSSPSLDRPKSRRPSFQPSSLAYPLAGTSMVRWQLLHVAAYFGHADAVKVPCLQPNHSPEWDPDGSCPGQALVERGANIEAIAVFCGCWWHSTLAFQTRKH
jgi:hypothetical protein